MHSVPTNTSIQTITVLSLDDNPLMGEVAERWFRPPFGFRHAGHFLTGEGVIDAAIAEHTDVILMDLEVPGTDTVGLIAELGKRAPHTRVLVLSGHLRANDIIDCLCAGAAGYVSKFREPTYILDAVRRVAAGEQVICDDAARAAGLA